MSKHKKAILLLLAIVMMFSLLGIGVSAATTTTAAASSYHNLYLYLAPYGATDRSLDREKTVATSYADVEELLITTEYTGGVWLRVRDSSGAAATNSSQLYYYDSWWRPGYLSGYGTVGREYYIKGQTSSASAYDASVTAIWCP